MKKVLVTGASGQLGNCFKKVSEKFPDLDFTFAGSDQVDLTMFGMVSALFRKSPFDYCINCAAYTQVESAESDREMAYLVNAEAVKNLAEVCRQNETVLVHFSTDYVFDGEKNSPYLEEDKTNPLNVYGSSKLKGEESIQQIMDQYFIFRTSWLYSDVGNNFFQTIMKKAREGADLNITGAQTGTPTSAYDLSEFVLYGISRGNTNYGLYHYSNMGEATWYDFAQEILILAGKAKEVELARDDSYQTLALRPVYSVLSKKKVLGAFQQKIMPWRESLAKMF